MHQKEFCLHENYCGLSEWYSRNLQITDVLSHYIPISSPVNEECRISDQYLVDLLRRNSHL